MPSFGRDMIRRFGSNYSELKNKAARDFENLLQVCYLFSRRDRTPNSSCISVHNPRFRRATPGTTQWADPLTSLSCRTLAWTGEIAIAQRLDAQYFGFGNQISWRKTPRIQGQDLLGFHYPRAST